MKDLTKGSILTHILQLSSFMAVSMVFQMLYFLADLYWVGRLGKDAIAAVSLAGNLTMIVVALSQTLGIGATTLISHAAGSKNKEQAQLIFNQAMVLTLLTGGGFLAAGMLMKDVYCSTLAADLPTVALGNAYLKWFIPAMALQFGVATMGAALRGTGNLKPTMLVQIATVILNIVLAPVLIFGWVIGKEHAMGVAGAAVTSFISIVLGTIGLAAYFLPEESYLRFHPTHWKPHFSTWWQMVKIGVPAGAEFGLISV